MRAEHKFAGSKFGPPCRLRRGKQTGFSLLEIMVAFTLLALSLTVLMQAFGGGVHLLGDAERFARAATLAQSQLARLGIDVPIAEGYTQGEWPPDYHWQMKVAPFYLPPPLAEHPSWQLFQVEVTVGWDEAGRLRVYRLTSLRIGKKVNAAR